MELCEILNDHFRGTKIDFISAFLSGGSDRTASILIRDFSTFLKDVQEKDIDLSQLRPKKHNDYSQFETYIYYVNEEVVWALLEGGKSSIDVPLRSFLFNSIAYMEK